MFKSLSKIIALILVMALTLSFTSFTTVFAAEQEFRIDSGNATSVKIEVKDANNLNVTVGGSPVTVPNADTIVISGGNTFPATSQNCVIEVVGSIGFPVNIKLKNVNTKMLTANTPALKLGATAVNLTLEGTNTLDGSGTASAIASTGTLTISGTGTLELINAATTPPAGLTAGTLTLNGGTVTAANGIAATGAVTIGGASKVTTTTKGISGSSITVNGTATVTAVSTGTTAALSATGAVTVLGGTVTATGNGTAAVSGTSVAVSGGILNVAKGTVSSLTISGTGNVAAKSGATLTGTTTLNDGTLSLTEGATVAALTVTGGTYQNTTLGGGNLFKTTFKLPGVTAVTNATLTADGKSQTVPTDATGQFAVYLPAKTYAVDALKVVTATSKTFTNKKALTVSGHSSAAADAGITLVTTPPPAAKTVTLTAPAASAYKKDVDVLYTCADKATADAFLAATKTIAFGTTPSLKLDPKNGYTITKTSDTKGTITIKGAANKVVKNDIPITVTANGFTAAATKVNVAKNTVKSVDTLVVEAPLRTSSSKMRSDYLSVVYVSLEGTDQKEAFPVTNWNMDKYRNDTRAEQTLTGTITKTTSTVVEYPTNVSKKATAKVTLYREDTGGGSSSNDRDDDVGDAQYFWSDVKDQIGDAEKGDKIKIETGSFDKVPTTVLDKLKGKDVTLILERPVGKDIIIPGKSVKAPPAGLIYYSLTELATIYKNASTSSSGTSSSSSTANNNNNNVGGGTTTPTTPKPSSSSVAPAPSSSVAESSSSSEEEEEESSSSSSSEEEEETDIPVDDKPKPEKKKMSPVMAVVIITAGVAALSGVAALVVLRKRP